MYGVITIASVTAIVELLTALLGYLDLFTDFLVAKALLLP